MDRLTRSPEPTDLPDVAVLAGAQADPPPPTGSHLTATYTKYMRAYFGWSLSKIGIQ
jgi:hypothetical protein